MEEPNHIELIKEIDSKADLIFNSESEASFTVVVQTLGYKSRIDLLTEIFSPVFSFVETDGFDITKVDALFLTKISMSITEGRDFSNVTDKDADGFLNYCQSFMNVLVVSLVSWARGEKLDTQQLKVLADVSSQLGNIDEDFSQLVGQEIFPEGLVDYVDRNIKKITEEYSKSPEYVPYWFSEKADKIETLYNVLLENKYIEANEHFMESLNNDEVNLNHRTRWKVGQAELILLVRTLAGQKMEHRGESVYAIICKLFVNAKGEKIRNFDPDGLRALNSQNYEKLSGTQRPSPKQQALKNLIDFL